MSKRLVEQYPNNFNNKFEDNKKFLDELKIMDGKLIRNKIAGYIVSVVEKKKIK
jgi:ribosomal protein S17E